MRLHHHADVARIVQLARHSGFWPLLACLRAPARGEAAPAAGAGGAQATDVIGWRMGKVKDGRATCRACLHFSEGVVAAHDKLCCARQQWTDQPCVCPHLTERLPWLLAAGGSEELEARLASTMCPL